MSKYYISKGISKKGPYTKEQLKAFKIQSDTLIWVDGNSEWQEASNFEDLKDVIIATPPSRTKSFTISSGKFRYKTLIFALLLTLPFYLLKSADGIKAYIFKLENKEAIKTYEFDRANTDTLASSKILLEQHQRNTELARKVIDSFNQEDLILNSFAKDYIFPLEDRIDIMETIKETVNKYMFGDSLFYSIFIFIVIVLIQLIPHRDIANYLNQFPKLFR